MTRRGQFEEEIYTEDERLTADGKTLREEADDSMRALSLVMLLGIFLVAAAVIYWILWPPAR